MTGSTGPCGVTPREAASASLGGARPGPRQAAEDGRAERDGPPRAGHIRVSYIRLGHIRVSHVRLGHIRVSHTGSAAMTTTVLGRRR